MNLFFQAEDSIRYGHVTGVQTCTLPISLFRPSEEPRSERGNRPSPGPPPAAAPASPRSEERRVGKECKLSKQQQLYENKSQKLTQAKTDGQYFTNDKIKEMTRNFSTDDE